MMGVLNFAHASLFMLGAYLSFQFGRWVGFWPALVVAPLVCGVVGAAIERYGLSRVHARGHVAEILFTFGLAYLIVLGSLVAFSAYAWLLRNAPTPVVATYAYVNPAVAVFLGWLIGGEHLYPRTIGAAAIIIAGVALIVSGPRIVRRRNHREEQPTVNREVAVPPRR